MSKQDKKIPMWAKTGHAAPITRRDFLGAGVIPFAATALMPTWMQIIFGSQAQAQSTGIVCPPDMVHDMVPFVSLNLAGGAAMGGNYLPVDASGAPLPSYSKMGLGDGNVPKETEFGNVLFAGAQDGVMLSKFLEGIRASATRATLDKTAFMSFCVRSRDDSGENTFDVSGLIYKSGVVGSMLPNLGTQNTRTGSNQKAVIVPPPAPLVVGRFDTIANSLGYSAALGSQLTAPQKTRLAKLISDLGGEQARKLASMDGGEAVRTVVECAGIKNVSVLQKGTAGVDPIQNAQIGTLWGLAANQKNSQSYVFSSLVYNALLGQAGPVSLTMGGYDYHDNTRTTGNTRDLNAGMAMGRILETAAILGKRVCLYVTSDGSVVSADSATDRQSPWTSDRGSAGIAYMLMFDPAGRPALKNPGTAGNYQVGYFTSAQAAHEKTLIGNEPGAAAQAVFANYLALNKKLGMYKDLVPSSSLVNNSNVDSVVKVA